MLSSQTLLYLFKQVVLPQSIESPIVMYNFPDISGFASVKNMFVR